MRSLKTLEDRLANQERARRKLETRLQAIANKPKKANRQTKGEAKKGNPEASSPPTEQRIVSAWTSVRSEADSQREYTDAGRALKIQPWARRLVNTALEAASLGGVYLCFGWPAQFESIALVHALINIERHFAKDMRGIRSLLYPGTHTSRLALNSVQISRAGLVRLYRSMLTTEAGSAAFKSETRSKAFESVLEALNDIEMWSKEVPDPSLGVLTPVFVFDPGQSAWTSAAKVQLDNTLRNINRRTNRRDIREQISADWCEATCAPGAMFVLHSSAAKKDWKLALASRDLAGDGLPDLVLLNGTSSASQTNYTSVQRIPDFLRYCLDNGYRTTGAVIVTDDPRTFFSMRSRLAELRISFLTRVWVAEGEEAILSSDATPEAWRPTQRTLSNFSVAIVDADASRVALAFQKIANDSGVDGDPPYQAAMAACLFVLRLSNLPAGYADLASLETGTESDFQRARNSWVDVKLGLQSSLSAGAFNRKRDELQKAIAKAERLIDDWSDATPMALRLLSEVKKYAVDSRTGVSIVLPSGHYIELARRFLQRKLGDAWHIAEPRLRWITLSSVRPALANKAQGTHFVFVGINRRVFELLVTHQDIPHGTTVLIAYRQADSTLMTLKGLSGLDEFKAYRGRIGLLIQEIERRLREVQNPMLIGKLGEISLAFKFDDTRTPGASSEQQLYKFELENGRRAYTAGWIYRYESDEPPYFRRVAAQTIVAGDLIFDMSDELRSELEDELQVGLSDAGSALYPERVLLKLYHDEVKSRCARIFGASKRSLLARLILAAMIRIDPAVRDCRAGRIYYWLALGSDGDTRPHAPKDAKYFKVFCKALEIDEEWTARHWNFIRNARRLNQNLGRELAARYAEILFHPESAMTYRKVSETTINRLQEKAVQCVFRVERIVPPDSLAHA